MEIGDIMKLKGEQHKLARNAGAELARVKSKFVGLVQRLLRLKGQMFSAVSEMEGALYDIRQSLSPLQTANFVNWIEKTKGEDELLKADLWNL